MFSSDVVQLQQAEWLEHHKGQAVVNAPFKYP